MSIVRLNMSHGSHVIVISLNSQAATATGVPFAPTAALIVLPQACLLRGST
jgi:hypothetical protein